MYGGYVCVNVCIYFPPLNKNLLPREVTYIVVELKFLNMSRSVWFQAYFYCPALVVLIIFFAFTQYTCAAYCFS